MSEKEGFVSLWHLTYLCGSKACSWTTFLHK